LKKDDVEMTDDAASTTTEVLGDDIDDGAMDT
jgi:hypothetical protein